MDNEVMRLYGILYEKLGPQGWWPGEGPLEIIVGAILTQSVSWTNVEKAIARLKEAGRLDEAYLADPDLEELAGLIRSTLYHNQKARKLKAFFSWFRDEYGFDYDRLFKTPVSQLRQRMLGLWGLGPETVDSILCYAGNLPVMVVDAYTRRILARMGLAGGQEGYAELQEYITRRMPVDVALYNEMHALLVRLAKDWCRAQRPLCLSCPVADICAGGQAASGHPE